MTTIPANTSRARIRTIAQRIEEYWRALEEIATDLDETGQQPNAQLDQAVNLLSDAISALEHA